MVDIRKQHVEGVVAKSEKKLTVGLGRRVADTLDEMPPDTWGLLRELFEKFAGDAAGMVRG